MDKRSDKKISSWRRREDIEEMRSHHYVKAHKAINNRKKDRHLDALLKSGNPKHFTRALEEDY